MTDANDVAAAVSDASTATVASNHLRRRLLAMADRAKDASVSRESIQTLARWLCFPRKTSVLQSMAAAFASVVASELPSSELRVEKRLELYLKVLQEVFLPTASDGGGSVGAELVARQVRKSGAVRTALGDVALMALAEAVASFGSETPIANSLLQSASQWDEASVFATPTIVSEVRRIVKTKKPAPAPSTNIEEEEEDEATMTTTTTTTTTATTNSTATTTTSATPTLSLTPPDIKEEMEIDAVQNTTEHDGNQQETIKEEKDETKPITNEEEGKNPFKTAEKVENDADDDGDALFEDTEEQERIAEAMMMEEGGADEGAEEEETTGGGGSNAAQDAAKDKETQDLDSEMEGQVAGAAITNMSELLVPCRAIATLQITREIANDRALQAASTLYSIPKEVQSACETALKAYEQAKQENEEDEDEEELLQRVKPDLDWDQMKLSDEILDLDVEEALSNVRLLRDFVTKQRDARSICLDLLRKSHCNFGSQQAAHEFSLIAHQLALVQQRRIVLEDAMELEGMDMLPDDEDEDKEEETLKPFSWYVPPANENNDDETSTTAATAAIKSDDAGTASDREQ